MPREKGDADKKVPEGYTASEERYDRENDVYCNPEKEFVRFRKQALQTGLSPNSSGEWSSGVTTSHDNGGKVSRGEVIAAIKRLCDNWKPEELSALKSKSPRTAAAIADIASSSNPGNDDFNALINAATMEKPSLGTSASALSLIKLTESLISARSAKR